MATQRLERLHQELTQRLSRGRVKTGFAIRKQQQDTESSAWRATVTKHMPEPWPAARLALQARIAALDVN